MILKFFKNYRLKKILATLNKFGDCNDITNDRLNISFPENVSIGSYVYIGPNASINGLGGVKIGSGTIIGPNLTIHSANHKFSGATHIPYDNTFIKKEVEIGENVWIGGNVILVPGAVVGEGAIIGAGSVVSGIIPDLSIVVGNPCKIIKARNKQDYYQLKNSGMIYMKHKINNNLKPQL